MTGRERLLTWIKEGDPGEMPLLFWVGSEMASAWYGEDRAYSAEERTRAARECGAATWFCVSSPMMSLGVRYSDALSASSDETIDADGDTVMTNTFHTPEGDLCDVRKRAPGKPLEIMRNYVMGAGDVPAYRSLILEAGRALLARREQVIEDVAAGARKMIAETGDEGPVMMWIFMPMVELTCSAYFKQEEGVLFIHDQPELLGEMMDLHLQTTMMWIEAGVAAGVDIFGYSVNGYEIYSPSIYRDHIVPQARKINARIREVGKLSWWHCCGKFQNIVDKGLWAQMHPDVMESYSPPPCGDITDVRRVREATDVLASRGAMPVDTLWRCTPEEIKARTREIIEAMRGKRHMLGGTDQLLPGTPRRSLEAMRDAVVEAGMAFD